MKKILFILPLLFFTSGYTQSLEERVEILEKKVKLLEEKIKVLEGKKEFKNVETISEDKTFLETKKPYEIVWYRVLKKYFEKASLKESLWKRDDQIILKMEFKSNLNKPVSAITGKIVIYDKKEKPLMEKKVNINKAFNFFKGTDIKPGEKVRYTVYFTYDNKNPKHRFVKEKPLSELIVKFYPEEVHFSDGTIKYVRYKR